MDGYERAGVVDNYIWLITIYGYYQSTLSGKGSIAADNDCHFAVVRYNFIMYNRNFIT
jgi:hypothetical protein